MRQNKNKKQKFYFSKIELIHLLSAALAISFAFEFVIFREEIFSQFSLALFGKLFLDTLAIVTTAFVLHELGHKFVAQKYGLWAEFRAWPLGLILAVALALVTRGGFVFAAPGAVLIVPAKKTPHGFVLKKLTKSQIGHIGIIGILINICLATLFLVLTLLFGSNLTALASQVNAWLAIFNLLPLSVLDGAKVWYWSKPAWLAAMLASASLFFLILLI